MPRFFGHPALLRVGFGPVSSMSLPTERYALLIRQLGAELAHIRGWKKRVAERLGVHPSYVSRILSGEKLTIGPDVLDRARDRLGLDPRFFFSDQPAEPQYRDFLVTAVRTEEAPPREQGGLEEEVARAKAELGRERLEIEEAFARERAAIEGRMDQANREIAALRFLGMASNPERMEWDLSQAGAELLQAAQTIPVVQHAVALERALARDDDEATEEAAWRLAATLLASSQHGPGHDRR